MASLIVTIDGPAGSGKSTIARLLAQKLNAAFLDTGAMYRAVTLTAMQAGIDLAAEQQMLELMQKTRFQFSATAEKMTVTVDGRDVTEQIRRPDVTANAKYAASAPTVRAALVDMQRQFAADHKAIVTEGRDQGTVAFPDAHAKFYLTADAQERARRRHTEMATQGKPQSVEQIQQAIEQRDRSDAARTVGPMKPADDAIVIDTTNLTIDQVVSTLLSYVNERCPRKS